MATSKTIARIAGLLYLIIIICAGFSEGYVRSSLIIPGDATTTAQNILASEGLFRLGFVSDLVAFLADAVVAILLYILLKPVSKILSIIAAVFRLLAHPAIASLNLLNHYIVLQVLSGADFLSTFQTDQLHALAMLLLEAHTYGYLVAGAFFGFHCLLLGYLLYKSNLFPAILGILMAVASAGYLVESFGNFLFPGYEVVYTWIVAVTAVIGELSFCLWLMVKGVKE